MFDRENDVTKDSIRDFEIIFFVPDPADIGGEQAGTLNVQIGLSNGQILTKKYDLLARLQDDAPGQVHLSNLADLRDYIRARLEAEVLPL